MKKTSYGAPLIPNPDRQDIAKNWKQWMHRFLTGHTHVTYALLISAGVGAYLVTLNSIPMRLIGVLLIATGAGGAADQAGHLFTN